MEEFIIDENEDKSTATRLLPYADMDFATVATDAITFWKEQNWLTLQYTTQAIAEQKLNLFVEIVSTRKEDGGTRPQVTQALKTINAKINRSIKHIKGYIAEEHSEEEKIVVQSYYPAFGIVKKGASFAIPKDASKRKSALKLMLKGITANAFEDKKYGLAFWTDIKVKYDELVENARALDGAISDNVGEKNELKEWLTGVLVSINYALKANFPNTHHEQLRKWGFQKEKY